MHMMFFRNLKSIGYYQYMMDNHIFCWFRPFPTKVWWLLLENTTGTVHCKGRPGDADRVFPALPSGFHLHDNERFLSGRSAGSVYFNSIYKSLWLWVLIMSCHAHTFYSPPQLLCSALSCCVGELRVQLNAMDTVISLPWIHAAYDKFKVRLQNLSRIICIEPQVVQHLSENHHSRVGDELVSILSLSSLLYHHNLRFLTLQH